MPILLEPPHLGGLAAYSQRQLVRLLRLPARRLRRWQMQGLFPRLDRYEWPHILLARKLWEWDQGPITPQRLRACVEALRERWPSLASDAAGAPDPLPDPLLEAGFHLFAQRLELRHQGLAVDVLSGQIHLPFDAPPALDPRPIAAQGDSVPELQADHWFRFALSLEATPELRDQAGAAYQRCLDLDPLCLSAYINLGTLRFHQKDFPAAERCYRTALGLEPDYAMGHFNLGNVLDETGHLAAAIEAYQEAVRLAPDYADAHYNLAVALQRQGFHRRAMPHWRQYLGLDQQSPWALHARTQLKQTLEQDVLQLVAPRPQ